MVTRGVRRTCDICKRQGMGFWTSGGKHTYLNYKSPQTVVLVLVTLGSNVKSALGSS